jgi:CarboxypepD_reg-like domain
MKVYLSAVITLIVVLELSAQDDAILFKGELINAKTQEKIPWASIYIKGTSLGVPSNEQGRFEFSIARTHVKDSLIISALGYESVALLIGELQLKGYRVIQLKEKVYQLNEVTIESPGPAKIVMDAMGRWNRNFSLSNYEFDSFYRQTQKENGKYGKLWECSLRGVDHGYDNAKLSSVDLEYLHIRKSNDYRDKRTQWLIGFFKPQFIFTGENHSRDKALLNKNVTKSIYEYELDSVLYLNNNPVYVINARIKDNVKEFLFDARFYIRASDYAFVQMDFNGKNKLQYLKPSGIPKGLKLKMQEYRSTYIFKEIAGKMFMYYLNVYTAFNWTDQQNKTISQEENSEAIVQNIRLVDKKTETAVKPNFGKHNFGIPHTSYDPEFWTTYELVKQLPYDKKLSEDLQKSSSLEEQFTKNGPKQVRK